MPDSDPLKTIPEQLAALEATLRWKPRRKEIIESLRTLMAAVDRPRLDALRRQHEAGIREASAVSGYKYLDVAFYTLQKLLLARDLGLNKGPPRRVLDIGTGGGHFPFVCRFLGHQAVGIDIENAIYEGIAACLGVQRTIVRVEPLKPLPNLGERFDLITASDITFNDKADLNGRRHYWSLAEWKFFLDDLIANQLRYPGTLYLRPNKEFQAPLRGVTPLVYNRGLLAMAARNGATVSRRHGTIKLSVTSRREIR